MRKSCGCRSQNRIFETGINIVFALYKAKAKKRNIEFLLSKYDVKNLISLNCFYCGIDPQNEIQRNKSKKLQIRYGGIDRRDNLKGYTIDNCVPCCLHCNRSKATLTFEEWRSYISRLYKFQGITNGI
jgi:hypothetical protein